MAEVMASANTVESLGCIMQLMELDVKAEVPIENVKEERIPAKCRRIRQLMIQKHITDIELEKLCSSSRSSINRYKNGKAVPSDWRYRDIMKALKEV